MKSINQQTIADILDLSSAMFLEDCLNVSAQSQAEDLAMNISEIGA